MMCVVPSLPQNSFLKQKLIEDLFIIIFWQHLSIFRTGGIRGPQHQQEGGEIPEGCEIL